MRRSLALATALAIWPFYAAAEQAASPPTPAPAVTTPPAPSESPAPAPVAATASTQSAPPASASADGAAPLAPTVAAPAGTAVEIEIVNAVSSKTAKTGDHFPIRLAEPIVEGDKVIVAAGAVGEGEVLDATHSRALGKPAKLVVAARYLEINGRQVRVKGMRLGGAGTDKTSEIVAESFIPYIGIFFDFQHGGEYVIPAGTRAQAKLAEDLTKAPVAPLAGGPTVTSDAPENHP